VLSTDSGMLAINRLCDDTFEIAVIIFLFSLHGSDFVTITFFFFNLNELQINLREVKELTFMEFWRYQIM
jgi:hypothetical protein